MAAFTIVDGQVVPIDADGNPILSVQDGDYYRLAVEASIKPGSSIGISPAVSVTATAFSEYLEESGGSPDLNVDGSVTPVVFDVTADPVYDIVLREMRIVMTSGSITWGAFGKGGGALTNGVLFEARLDEAASPVTLTNLTVNEEFLLLQFPDTELGGLRHVVLASYGFAEEKIVAGSSDFVRVTVRDELDSAVRDISFFRAKLYGSLMESV